MNEKVQERVYYDEYNMKYWWRWRLKQEKRVMVGQSIERDGDLMMFSVGNREKVESQTGWNKIGAFMRSVCDPYDHLE